MDMSQYFHSHLSDILFSRQAGILVREIANYISELGITHWPCVIAGGTCRLFKLTYISSDPRFIDFNFTPSDPAYALIAGDPLLPEQQACISESRVVHASVDPTIPKTDKFSSENDGEEAVDPDRVITNARMATETDGLLFIAELQALYEGVQLRSVYDVGLRQSKIYAQNPYKTFGNRFSLSPSRRGSCEPEYTSYAHYWKTVLGEFVVYLTLNGNSDLLASDYIFVLDDKDSRCQILSLLAPHHSENLEPGLPQQGVCGSDHISLGAELFWRSIGN